MTDQSPNKPGEVRWSPWLLGLLGGYSSHTSHSQQNVIYLGVKGDPRKLIFLLLI